MSDLYIPSIYDPTKKPLLGQPLVHNDGLVGSWLFNENGGGEVKDTSGFGNTGTLVGDTHFVPGIHGPALSFEGAGDYVSLTLATTKTDNFSIECWFYPEDAAVGNTGIVFLNGDIGSPNGYYIRWRDSNLYFAMNATIGTPVAGQVQVWQHVVGVRRNGTNYLYLDGIENNIGSTTPSTPTLATSIGASSTGAAEFSGLVSSARIYNRPLTANEVSRLYTDSFWQYRPEALYIGAAGGATYLEVITDGLGCTDAYSSLSAAVRIIAETLGITDAQARTYIATRAIAESLGITDAQARAYIGARTIAESLALTDADAKDEGKNIAESMDITDAASNVSVILRTIAESIGITDALTAGAIYLETVNDGIGITDTFSTLSAVVRVIAESLGITDDQARAYVGIRTIAEALGITDAVIAGNIYLETVNDDIGILDAYASLSTVVRVVAETLGITDDQARTYVGIRTIAEALGLADTASKNEGKNIAESLGITDIDAKNEGKNIAESMGITDNVSRLCVALRILAESVGITDAVINDIPGSIAYIEIISEAIGVADSMFKLQPVVISAAWAWIGELIAEEGRIVTLHKAQGRRNSAQPWRGNTSFVSPEPGLEVTAVMVRYKTSEVDGSLVLKTDQKALIAVPATGQNVLEYDILVDTSGDAREYKVVRPVKIHPGTEILLYILQVRR